MRINYAPGYISAGMRMWGWVITTKWRQFFIGIKTRVSP